MSLLPLFQWAAKASLFAVMRDSKWGFAMVEMVHLLALAALGGIVLVVDLGILGLGLWHPPSLRRAMHELAPLLLGSLVLTVLSGLLLVSAEALKCYYHPAFRIKMVFFAAAVIFHFTIHRKSLWFPEGARPPVGAKVAAVVSLFLWLGVGLAGRAIGFF